MFRVFVSSTYENLRPERTAVEKALQRLRRTDFAGMEYFGSAPAPPSMASLEELERCQLLVAIIGPRYGSGIVELECDHANGLGLPCFIYVSEDLSDAPESDPRLSGLLADLESRHTLSGFADPNDLAAKVTADLHNWLFDTHLRELALKNVESGSQHEALRTLLGQIIDFSAVPPEVLASLRAANISTSESDYVAGAAWLSGLFNPNQAEQAFAGSYAPLRETYLRPDSVFRRVDIESFTGREWLAEAVENFLEENDRGLFVLEASAGLGKTAFLAHLARKKSLIHHFVELSPGREGMPTALRNLAAQIVCAWKLNPYTLSQTQAGTRPDFLQGLLFEAARKRDEFRPDEKIVLVIDALDEAGGAAAGHNALGLPKVLPDGVFLIVSQRPVSVPLFVDGNKRVVRLRAAAAENLNDMWRYLKGATRRPKTAQAVADAGYTDEQFVDSLLEKCGGLWIYLQYILAEIEAGLRKPLELEMLPQGVWQYYAEHWMTWAEHNGRPWNSYQKRVLATLGAAQEALPLELVCALAQAETNEDDVQQLLSSSWRPFIAVAGDERNSYRLYHASIRELLSGAADYSEMTVQQEEWTSGLVAATREAHGRFADYFIARWGGMVFNLNGLSATRDLEEIDFYGIRHVLRHLEDAGRREEVHQVLSLEWSRKEDAEAVGEDALRSRNPTENAWYLLHERLLDFGGYLADLERGWKLASDNAAPEGTDDARLPLLLRYVMMFASMNSLARSRPPSLIRALVSRGLLEKSSALAQARAVPEEEIRYRMLRGLIPLLAEEDYREALELALSIPAGNLRASLLCRLVPRVESTKREEIVALALESARKTPFPAQRIGALAKVVPLLPQDDVESVLAELVSAYSTSNEPLASFRIIAPLLPENTRRVMLEKRLDLLENVLSDSAKVLGLATLAEYLPRETMEETVRLSIQASHRIYNPVELARLAKRLASDAGEQRALAVVEQWCTDRHASLWQVRAFLNCSARESGGISGEILSIARKTADGIVNNETSFQAFLEILSLASDEQRRKVLPTALDKARKIRSGHDRAKQLAKLSEFASPEGAEALLREALAAVRTLGDEEVFEDLVDTACQHVPNNELDNVPVEVLQAGSELGRFDVELRQALAGGPQHRKRAKTRAINRSRSAEGLTQALMLIKLVDAFPDEGGLAVRAADAVKHASRNARSSKEELRLREVLGQKTLRQLLAMLPDLREGHLLGLQRFFAPDPFPNRGKRRGPELLLVTGPTAEAESYREIRRHIVSWDRFRPEEVVRLIERIGRLGDTRVRGELLSLLADRAPEDLGSEKIETVLSEVARLPPQLRLLVLSTLTSTYPAEVDREVRRAIDGIALELFDDSRLGTLADLGERLDLYDLALEACRLTRNLEDRCARWNSLLGGAPEAERPGLEREIMGAIGRISNPQRQATCYLLVSDAATDHRPDLLRHAAGAIQLIRDDGERAGLLVELAHRLDGHPAECAIRWAALAAASAQEGSARFQAIARVVPHLDDKARASSLLRWVNAAFETDDLIARENHLSSVVDQLQDAHRTKVRHMLENALTQLRHQPRAAALCGLKSYSAVAAWLVGSVAWISAIREPLRVHRWWP